MEIKRRINGKTGKYPVYTKEQAKDKKLDYVYWRQAEVGDWGLTDDGFVAECYDRKNYTDKNGRVKTFVKLTCGVGWDSGLPHMHKWSLKMEKWTMRLLVRYIDLTRRSRLQRYADSLNRR